MNIDNDEKSENYNYAVSEYKKLTTEQKEKISLEMFYNSICHFHHIDIDKIIEILMNMPKEDFDKLENSFIETRTYIKEMQEALSKSNAFDKVFYSPNIEDILFYQITNDLPIS